MALIKCRECGREVSALAKSCVGCGAPIAVASARQTSGPGQAIKWLLILFVGLPILLFFGSAFVAGTMDAFSNDVESDKPYTGKIRVDHGTEYELVNVPSTIGGECAGWNAVSLQRPGDPTGGMTNLMCWRQVGDQIEVTTKLGEGRRSDPKAVFTD